MFTLRRTSSLILTGWILFLSACAAPPQPEPATPTARDAPAPTATQPEPVTETPAQIPPSPTDLPTISPASTCEGIERLALDSPEAQRMAEEFIAGFKQQQPTEYMGLAIRHRIDRLGEWAVIQGSVSGEGFDVIAVRQTEQGYRLAERYTITSPLASFEEPHKIIPQYFKEKLPEAPAALFDCLDQSWLFRRARRMSADAYRLAYIATDDYTTAGVTQLYTIHSDGVNPTVQLSEPMLVMGLDSSPYGDRIAFWGCPGSLANDCQGGEDLDVWSIDWDGGGVFSNGSLRNLTQDSSAADLHPDWSPDGNWIAYYCTSAGGGGMAICVISPQGEPAGDPLAGTTPVWSPLDDQGQVRLAYLCFNKSHSDICTALPDGSSHINLTNSPFDEHSPAWSPDGEWLAYVSNKKGDIDIYKICADYLGETRAIRLTDDPRDAAWPAWSPDGRQIAYGSGMGPADLVVVNADGSDAIYIPSGIWSPPIWRP